MRYRFILILIHFAAVLAAQDYSFQTINSLNGLSQNDVSGIHHDSRGFMWFATYDGLNKYDGYEFTVYRKSLDGDNSARSNLMHGIWEGENNDLWITTENSGLFRLDMITDSIVNFSNTPDNPNLLSSNRTVAITGYPGGNIWFVTSTGVNHLKYQGKNNFSIRKYPIAADTSNFGIKTHPVRTFCKVSDTSLWIIGHDAITIFSLDNEFKQTGKIKELYDRDNRFEDAVVCPEGIIVGSLEGVFVVRNEEYLRGDYKFHQVSDIRTTLLCMDNNSDLWVGSANGVYLLKHSSNTQNPYIQTHHFTTANSNLSSNNIRSIYKDKKGLLWFGTNGGGVSSLDLNKTKFRHYPSINQQTDKLKLRSIYQDNHGNIWFGSENYGLYYLSEKNERNYHSQYIQFMPNEESNWHGVFSFSDVHTKRGSFVWAGCTYHNILVELNIDKINTEEFSTPIRGTEDMTFAIMQGHDSTIWIGTYWGGLFRHNPYHEPAQFDAFTSENSSISSNIVRSIIEDDMERIWVGTGDGLCLLTPEERKKELPDFTVFHEDINNPSSISNDYILPLYQSQTGDIWIGTMGGGINKYIEATDTSKGFFISFTTKNGLPNDVIKQILEDKEGNLWISSNKGLSRFNPNTLAIKNYDVTDGLQGNEFGELTGCRLNDGELLFGGVNGFNAFYPHEITEDSTIPEIALTRFQLFGFDVNINESINGRILLNKQLNETKSIQLKYFENSFRIYFAGLHFSAPHKNEYKYILEGFDDHWNSTDADSRFANYTNIEPGNYTFKVMASNADKVWNPIAKEINLTIKPPFWETLLFRIFFIASVILALYFAYKQRIRKYKLELARRKEYEHVLTSAKTKAEESDNLKSSIIANLSHEIRTPVNGINGFSELLTMDNLTEERRKKYSKIIRQKCNDLIKLLDSILNLSAAYSGSMKIDKQLSPLGTSLIEATVGAKEKISAEKKEIEVKLIDDNIDLKQKVKTDHYKVLSILNNLLDNAIKFTEKGTIEIGCSIEGKTIQYFVADTGIGIPENHRDVIFEEFRQSSIGLSRKYEGIGLGLSLCKSYLAILDGKIWLDSEEGKGSTFYFTIPYEPANLNPE